MRRRVAVPLDVGAIFGPELEQPEERTPRLDLFVQRTGLLERSQRGGHFGRRAVDAQYNQSMRRLFDNGRLRRGQRRDELFAIVGLRMPGQDQGHRVAQRPFVPQRTQQRDRHVGRQMPDEAHQFGRRVLPGFDRRGPEPSRGRPLVLLRQALDEQGVLDVIQATAGGQGFGQRGVAAAQLVKRFAYAKRPVAAGKLAGRVQLPVQPQQAIGRRGGHLHAARTGQ